MLTVEEKEKARKVVDDLSRYVNTCDLYDMTMAFVDQMVRKHPTLQQNFTRICVAWFLRLSDTEKYRIIDGRNEASVKLAKQVKQIFEDAHLPFV